MEICHSPELILRAYEALIAEAERSAAFRKLLSRARARRLRDSAQGSSPRRFTPHSPPSNSKRCAARILRFGETVAKLNPIQEAQPA